MDDLLKKFEWFFQAGENILKFPGLTRVEEIEDLQPGSTFLIYHHSITPDAFRILTETKFNLENYFRFDQKDPDPHIKMNVIEYLPRYSVKKQGNFLWESHKREAKVFSRWIKEGSIFVFK